MTVHTSIAIIGTGFSGLGMACQLKRHGIEDFIVLERATDVGGTWRDNTYPGAACDIQSDLYSFSFAPWPLWEHRYGRQPEIERYLRAVANRFDLPPHIVFGAEVLEAVWEEENAQWRIQTAAGEFTANILIAGAGPLVEPKWPTIDGLDDFTGVKFHSAQWDHSADLAGKRIGVIGTGASAIQFVPELQKVAAQLTVFQRTPPWIVARHDRPSSSRRKKIFAALPFLQRLSRLKVFWANELKFVGFNHERVGRWMEGKAVEFLHHQVSDADLRRELTPGYRIGCKRVLISSSYYPAVSQPNVELLTAPIVRVEGDVVVTGDGRRSRVDVLIAGTGFSATDMPIAHRILGKGGRRLSDDWDPHMTALRGTAVAGFPNLFLLVGPNTALGHNSVVYMIEAQIEYIIKAIHAMDRSEHPILEADGQAQARYDTWVQQRLEGSVWTSGGCTSFYLDAGGRNTTLWPMRARSFRRQLQRFRHEEYRAREPEGAKTHA